MEFNYDRESDAAYLRLVKRGTSGLRQVVLDDPELFRPIVVDLDAEGHVIGFEFLEASAILPARLLDAAG
jgi:uncharacterized protein YuzE